jgi:hypothetical protein
MPNIYRPKSGKGQTQRPIFTNRIAAVHEAFESFPKDVTVLIC